jgi:hypothetical protein
MLFLHVAALNQADTSVDDGFTLTEIAVRLRDIVAGQDRDAVGRYTALLSAAGFRFDDDYSTMRWAGGERGIYQVEGAFPRLTPQTVPLGISHVKYALDLSDCAGFLVPPGTLVAALRGAHHDL